MSKNELNKEKKRGRPRQFDREKVLLVALEIFWEKGYEQTSIADICKATGVNAPSLYAAFGNKSNFFVELINFYENKYWLAPVEKMFREAEVTKAIRGFFKDAINILLDRDIPCGCLVVLAGVHMDSKEVEINSEIKRLRQKMIDDFSKRLQLAVDANQLPNDTNIETKAIALNTFLEGLSLQLNTGIEPKQLKLSVDNVVGLLECKTRA